jgi:hypothetical protein
LVIFLVRYFNNVWHIWLVLLLLWFLLVIVETKLRLLINWVLKLRLINWHILLIFRDFKNFSYIRLLLWLLSNFLYLFLLLLQLLVLLLLLLLKIIFLLDLVVFFLQRNSKNIIWLFLSFSLSFSLAKYFISCFSFKSLLNPYTCQY